MLKNRLNLRSGAFQTAPRGRATFEAPRDRLFPEEKTCWIRTVKTECERDERLFMFVCAVARTSGATECRWSFEDPRFSMYLICVF